MRVGIVVSRKVGNAVVRNRVRRRLREAIRALVREGVAPGADMAGSASGAPSFDMVVIARPSAAGVDFWELRAALERALERAGLR